jgi:four helix bundle protein
LKSQIPGTNVQINPNDQISISKQISMTNDQNLKQKSYDLEERTLEFAKGIIRLCKSLPEGTINRGLVAQLVRAGGSVGANYREANDALGKKDFVYRMRITRKEAKECHHWLQLVLETNPEFKNSAESLLKEAEELKRIFSAIIDKSQ